MSTYSFLSCKPRTRVGWGWDIPENVKMWLSQMTRTLACTLVSKLWVRGWMDGWIKLISQVLGVEIFLALWEETWVWGNGSGKHFSLAAAVSLPPPKKLLLTLILIKIKSGLYWDSSWCLWNPSLFLLRSQNPMLSRGFWELQSTFQGGEILALGLSNNQL